MSNVTPDSIIQVASGFMASKHLYVANEVGLFEHLAEGPLTLDELSERTGVPRRTIRILADAMVALGLVDRQGDGYQNGPVAATYLSGRTPADLRPLLRFFNRISYPAWMHLEESMRTGQATYGHLNEELVKLFSEGVEAITAAAAMALATTYDFRQHRRVLDLGGGTGSFLLAVLRHYRHLETTLFEQPDVAAVARQHLAGTPAAEQVKIVEGDFFTDPIPEGHDAVIVANVVHIFSPEHTLRLLQRIRERAPVGARLLLVDVWTDPTHTQPTLAALMAGEFQMFSGEGDVYSEEEVHAWLQQTGWRPLEHKPLAGPASLIVAEAV
jgi:cyclopropane fatty-acyl-phospholipid synthase-like methyltransferase